MPRFVILSHDWPAPHLDFLLEAGPVLRAWRLLGEPAPGTDVPAEPNFDHRLVYLDYEGPVAGNRGSVARWDCGEFAWHADSSNGLEVELRGAVLEGRASIRRAGGGWVFRVEAG